MTSRTGTCCFGPDKAVEVFDLVVLGGLRVVTGMMGGGNSMADGPVMANCFD